MSLSQSCRLLGITRQSYYQHLKRQQQNQTVFEQVRAAVMTKRILMPRLGTRKLYYLLADEFKARGLKVGRDKLFAFLKAEHLLIQRRKSYTKTTDSKHWLKKHENRIQAKTFTEPERVWVSDITYVETKERVGYLSLVTDRVSRKIMGHHLSEDLRTEGVLQALQMAIRQRQTDRELIHHSDRGVQYCSAMYQDKLAKHGILTSMTEGGDCYQNALAERVNGILKDEFLVQPYATMAEARKSIAESILIYNSQRPHLSLKYQTPDAVQ